MELTDNYWSERYKNAQTGWDLGSPATPLKTYFEQMTDKSKAILIPGCGNAYEAEYLLENGFSNITLVDIAQTLVGNLQEKFKNYIESGKCRVLHADFFELTDSFDLVIEQTFFCAINPQLRATYAQKMAEILHPKGKLVGILFDKEFVGGPPFGGSQAEYIPYFEPYFNFLTYDACYNSIPPRADAELFVILQKK